MPYKSISGSQLKWLAIITMFLDHTSKIISFAPPMLSALPFETTTGNFYNISQTLFRLFNLVGRLAFPIFCFLLVEGFTHTSNRKKYALRLFLFAILSEIPYSLAFSQQFFNPYERNVFFTLLIGFLVIMGLDTLKPNTVRNVCYSIALIFTGVVAAEWLHTDYGGKIGVLLIVILYIFREQPLYKLLLGSLIILQNSIFGIFSFFILSFYNGKRGKQWQYFFYLFYPLHLLLLWAIQQFFILPYFYY